MFVGVGVGEVSLLLLCYCFVKYPSCVRSVQCAVWLVISVCYLATLVLDSNKYIA